MISHVDPWNISIYHKREGGIEKSTQKITFWHREACQEMANGDFEEHIFLSAPHSKHGFLFLVRHSTLYLYVRIDS